MSAGLDRAARRLLGAVGLVLLVVAATIAVAADAVGAHSEHGTLRVVSVTPEGDDVVRVTVEVAFDGDEHAAPDAVVQLGGRSREGVSLLPVVFAPTDVPGRLVAVAELAGPGVWDLRITATSPAAELELAYDPDDPGSFAPASVDLDGGGIPWRWIALGCAVVLAVFGVARLRSRR